MTGPFASSAALQRVPAPVPASARVAVIVPAYGVAHLLGEALASLQAQTLADWECVVVDDGAPDDVVGAVAPFLADPRIRFLATDNGGVSTARNRAIAVTGAPLIALLDGDDTLRPDYLARTTAVMEQDPEARLVTVNARIYGAVPRERLCFTGKQGSGDGVRGSLCDVLDRSFGVYIGSTFRRADFDAVGGFDPGMTHAEDFDLWVRLMLLGGHARYVDEVLGDYRVRSQSASASSQKMLQGNIRTFEKALEQLPGDSPAAEVARTMIASNARELRIELAIDRVIDGDTDAIAELRESSEGNLAPVWRASFLLWRLLPQLAPYMLAHRRKSHARGAGAPDADSAMLAPTVA